MTWDLATAWALAKLAGASAKPHQHAVDDLL